MISESIKRWLRLIAICMMQVLLTTAITMPKIAIAEEFKARWLKRPVSQYVKVTAPAEIWVEMIRVKKANAGNIFSYEYRNNDRWMTMGREEAALLPGLTSAQLSTLMTAPKRNSTLIFARYVPNQSRLVINAIKVEETVDGYIKVYQTYFSPYHGEHWAASRAFLTEDEQSDSARAGRNPFAQFLPSTQLDPSFQNIGWDGAMVAIGYAMQYFKAGHSILNVENLRMAQRTEKKGGFLKKKITVHVDGYAVPAWFIGLPSTIQDWGTSAAICVVKTNTTTDPASGKSTAGTCPNPAYIAYSGVSFDEWKGGTFPMAEEHIYHWEKTSSGFTVVFFTILIMAAAFFVGPEILAYVSSSGFGAPMVISAEAAAITAGVAYAGGTLLTTSGPASLTSVKQGAFGTVGDGVKNATVPGSDQEREATSILVQKHIDAPLTNLMESPKGGLAVATPDPGKVTFGSDQKSLRARFKHCKETQKLTGNALRECVVPKALPVEIPD